MSARAYRIQAAAQISGVSANLIRAWERRYGILEPTRTAAGYRTYSEADIEVLKRLKQHTAEGISIAQAATLVPGIRREVKAPRRIKVPRREQLLRWQAQILLAGQALDQLGVEQVIDEAYHSMTPVAFFEELVAPLMREVGDRWHRGLVTVAVEHLISFVVREKLLNLFSRAPRRSKHHVVCACPPEDMHEFGLLGTALRFRHAGWRVTLLGARTPVDELMVAVKTLEPELLALSLVDLSGASRFLNELAAQLPLKTPVLLGGQAALRLVALAEKHGFKVVKNEADWERFLRRTR